MDSGCAAGDGVGATAAEGVGLTEAGDAVGAVALQADSPSREAQSTAVILFFIIHFSLYAGSDMDPCYTLTRY